MEKSNQLIAWQLAEVYLFGKVMTNTEEELDSSDKQIEVFHTPFRSMEVAKEFSNYCNIPADNKSIL